MIELKEGILFLSGELSIVQAEELHNKLLEAQQQKTLLSAISVEGLTDIDVAIIQVLTAFYRNCEKIPPLKGLIHENIKKRLHSCGYIEKNDLENDAIIQAIRTLLEESK